MKRIDLLPDDVLLKIFDLYLIMNLPLYRGKFKKDIEAWQSLVHVCQRWRSLVFGSPLRLNLKLYCTPKTRAKDIKDVWPALPLIIVDILALSSSNITAALGQSNRVREVDLRIRSWQLEEVLASMQVPFPELTDLQLWSYGETPPVIPDSFLGGSAPRLRFLTLHSIPFPGLPKLLLSATRIVDLCLYGIPHSGYFSPQAIVDPLSVLSNLETLHLEFQSPQSHPNLETQSQPSQKRSILPVLAKFRFYGVTEYLEQLVARIETPQLNQMEMNFFYQIDFDCARLARFINCTPRFRALEEAHVELNDSTASITLGSRVPKLLSGYLLIDISCREPNMQLSFIEQICNSCFYPLSAVEDLYIDHRYLIWMNEAIEDRLWLQLLLPFTAVKNLFLSKDIAPGIADALQGLVGDKITEVLPSLRNIFVNWLEQSGSFQETIGQFVAARHLSGFNHPIAISNISANSNPCSTTSTSIIMFQV